MPLDKTLEGRRVRLNHTSDQYTKLKTGSLGTVKYESYDELWLEEKLTVDWDDGSNLQLIRGSDHWEILPMEEVK
jgi:hypothetical protein